MIDWSKTSWSALAFIIASLVITPILAIVFLWFSGTTPLGSGVELGLGQFFKLSRTTLLLMLGVGFGTIIIGVSTAWLVSYFQFKGRNFIRVFLVLPLAMPAYISAYVYSEVLTYGGSVQTALRNFFDWQSASDYYFPNLLSLGGAIFILSLALYPYIYVVAFAVFARRTSAFINAGRVLGFSVAVSFFKLALPLARPTLFAVLMLVFMECLNDIGVVEYFGVRTLTLGLYDSWLNRGNLSGAIEIALVMMFFSLGLIFLERAARKKQQYALTASYYDNGKAIEGPKQVLIILICLLPPLLGFLLPMLVLAQMGIEQSGDRLVFDILKLWTYARHSLALAVSATIIITAGGLALAFANHVVKSNRLNQFSQLSVMGYALPGVVLGLGIIIMTTQVQWDFSYMFLAGYKILLFAYFVRFLAIPFNLISSSLIRTPPQLEKAARILGLKISEVFGRVHLPLLRPAIWASIVLAFVEVMRELPLTLIIRTFNFETLATHIYTTASLGLLEAAALAALFLGLVGLLPAYLWYRTTSQSAAEATPGIEPR